MNTFEPTPLACLDYYIDINRKTEAIFLQTGDRTNFKTGDNYIDNVYLYHNIDRRYEGFIFLLEDFFMGTKSITHNIYGVVPHPEWTIDEYLFLIYAHRIFGSGTSNEANHGYHNSRLLEFGKFPNWRSFMVWLMNDDAKFVSCRVNQPPRYKLKQLVMNHFGPWCNFIKTNIKPNMSVKAIVDTMNEYNKIQGLHAFHFHYLLMAADLANYVNLPTPIEGLFTIDEWSECQLGPSSRTAMSVLKKKWKMSDFDKLVSRYNMKPIDLEDLLCVWSKYIKNPIWDFYVDTTKHTSINDFHNGWNFIDKHHTYEKIKNKYKW
jgi:hypothetical protein